MNREDRGGEERQKRVTKDARKRKKRVQEYERRRRARTAAVADTCWYLTLQKQDNGLHNDALLDVTLRHAAACPPYRSS